MCVNKLKQTEEMEKKTKTLKHSLNQYSLISGTLHSKSNKQRQIVKEVATDTNQRYDTFTG